MIDLSAKIARVYAGMVTRQPKKAEIDLPSVRSEMNIPYLEDRCKGHFLDIFWSKEADRPMPVFVVFNGGAFFRGNRSSSENLCMALAQRGFAVVNADIRDISGEAGVEDDLEDAVSILNWINFNRGRYGLDIGRCYVIGISYGALMAMWFALICNSDRINRAMGAESPWAPVKGIGLLSGMTDIHRNAARMVIIRESVEEIGRKNRELAESLALDTNHELRTLPRVYQVSSESDRSLPDTEKLNELLDVNRVGNEAMIFGRKDGFARGFVARDPFMPESTRAVSAMIRYLTLSASSDGRRNFS